MMISKIIRPYDVFISYVVEDREIVEILHDKLVSMGLRVWYAKNELYPGAEIRPLINKGLKSSRFGIAVITDKYNSYWAYGELFYLMNNKEALIPVLHGTTPEEIFREHPDLANRFCVSTSADMDQVAREILNRVRVRPRFYYSFIDFYCFLQKNRRRAAFSLSGLVLTLLLVGFLQWNGLRYPPEAFVEQTVNQHVVDVENLAQQEFQQDILLNNGEAVSINAIKAAEARFLDRNQLSHYRNSYQFFNGIDRIQSLAGLKNAQIFPREGQPEMPFGLTEYKAYLFRERSPDVKKLHYAVNNLLPLNFQVVNYRIEDGFCEIDVLYTHIIRYAGVEIWLDTLNDTRRREVRLFGTKPKETFVFEKKGEDWSLIGIR